jgi:hypothetical protein
MGSHGLVYVFCLKDNVSGKRAMLKQQETLYEKLPGRGLRREGWIAITRIRCTLWLAKDHILSVDNRVFSESYKRFYFRDIQAIILQRTNRARVWNTIWAGLDVLALLLALVFKGYGLLICLIFAGLFTVALLINWFQGPTCTCELITAVQRETLPSIGRLKTAEKVLPLLRRIIKRSQGE